MSSTFSEEHYLEKEGGVGVSVDVMEWSGCVGEVV